MGDLPSPLGKSHALYKQLFLLEELRVIFILIGIDDCWGTVSRVL
jgi:hypothetical protein